MEDPTHGRKPIGHSPGQEALAAIRELDNLVDQLPPLTPQQKALIHLAVYGSVVTDETGAIVGDGFLTAEQQEGRA